MKSAVAIKDDASLLKRLKEVLMLNEMGKIVTRTRSIGVEQMHFELKKELSIKNPKSLLFFIENNLRFMPLKYY